MEILRSCHESCECFFPSPSLSHRSLSTRLARSASILTRSRSVRRVSGVARRVARASLLAWGLRRGQRRPSDHAHSHAGAGVCGCSMDDNGAAEDRVLALKLHVLVVDGSKGEASRVSNNLGAIANQADLLAFCGDSPNEVASRVLSIGSSSKITKVVNVPAVLSRREADLNEFSAICVRKIGRWSGTTDRQRSLDSTHPATIHFTDVVAVPSLAAVFSKRT